MKTSEMEPVRFLSAEEMQRIHENACRILEDTGMKIDHLKSLEYLRDAGCSVDFERRTVKFPRQIIENAVTKMKANYSSSKRLPNQILLAGQIQLKATAAQSIRGEAAAKLTLETAPEFRRLTIFTNLTK